MLAYWIAPIVFLQFCILNGASGDLTITLVVFSGVPDPEWSFASNDPSYMEVQTRLNEVIENGQAYLPEDLPPILGYKGFLVSTNMKKKKSIEQDVAEGRLIVGPVTKELQMMLLKTMPKGLLPEDLRKQILTVIASGTVKPQVAPRRSKRWAPTYQTLPWTSRYRQLHNNCYNYATTVRTDTFAQPGRAGGNLLYQTLRLNGVRVRNSAQADGLNVLNVLPGNVPTNPLLPNQNHVVALVVWPDVDFHWYRLDDDGTWSHKPGRTRITQQDSAGQPINNPRNAAMLGYQFVTYMTVDRNNINII